MLIFGVVFYLFKIAFSGLLIYLAVLLISILYLRDEIKEIRSVKGFYRLALLIIPFLSIALCLQSVFTNSANFLPILLLNFMYTTLKGTVTN
jgi:uncharacterized membrane protein YhdT